MNNIPQAVTSAGKLQVFRDECVKTLQIPTNLVKQYERDNFPNDPQTQCYVKCIFNKLDLLDEVNSFNVRRFIKLLGDDQIDSENMIRAKVMKCAKRNEKVADICELAYRNFICFRKEDLVETL